MLIGRDKEKQILQNALSEEYSQFIAIYGRRRVGKVPLEKMEEEHVRKVVDKCHGNISKAAELLEISRQRLYKKLGK